MIAAPFPVGAVQVTLAFRLPAVATTLVGAFGTATVTVWSVNRSRSMFRTVSIPSLTFWPTTFAPVWVTNR